MANTPTPQQLHDWEVAHSWRPFTPMQQYLDSSPVVIESASGIKLRDTEGREYYDGTSSLWAAALGHRVPEIDTAIRDQLDKIAHSTTLGQGNPPSIQLAKRLAEIAPQGLTRANLADAGASAVEIALKIAIQYWANTGKPEKHKILGFTNNYHGDTLGAMAVAPDPLFHWPFLSMLPKNLQVPYPSADNAPLTSPDAKCDAAAIEPVEAMLREHAHKIAAIIIEPVQGAGGIFPAVPGFLKALRTLCDTHNVLLIVDEVATGFGRTGDRFACTAENITPDILCLGKALSGGYLPVSAAMTTERIYEAFLGDIADRRTLYHGHTFAGNPLGCAAALASIDLIESLLPSLPAKTNKLAELLAPLRAKPFVGEVRHRGLMVGIELRTRSGDPFPWHERVGYHVGDAARERGMLLRPLGSVVVFLPPLVSTTEELTDMVRILSESIDEATPALEQLETQLEPANA